MSKPPRAYQTPEGYVPVTGPMQGSFASFLTCSQCDGKKDVILFIDPGFPVQKQELVVMGQKFEAFDIYGYRGDKSKEKLESYLKKGNISTIVYSNPNNHSWICLKEEELCSIGELAKELMYYGVSTISLLTTGIHQEGLRACISFIQDHKYAQLDERMAILAENNPIK